MKNYKTIKEYLELPWTYTIEIDKDENGEKIYVISVNELPGVKTDAPSVEEAMELIKEPMEATFELYMDMGEEIPLPIREDDFKGDISYRTTTHRHYLIARESQRRKQSLSRVIDDCIDATLNQRGRR